MANFIEHTMPGAAFDSSARDPPPRCHPGTRLSTIEKTRQFCSLADPKKRILWMVGPAGVGKSAIMQSVAETSPNLGASLFLSVNGRNDPTKIMSTLAYQLAIRQREYKPYLRQMITDDPAIVNKSMGAQFHLFFVEPFVKHALYKEQLSLIVSIDGLDECEGSAAQCQLLELISRFTIEHPSTPILWVIASRPEPHISGFFDSLAPIYDKIELSVSSDESIADVEKYLRNSLSEIQSKYPALRLLPQWPTEEQILNIVAAASGLFAYATTAIRFIDDPEYGSPESQLELLLEVIHHTRPLNDAGDDDLDPMAQLDALYERIISRIPKRVLPKTLGLLSVTGILDGYPGGHSSLRWGAECLCMPANIAYGTLHHLHSVLRIPLPQDTGTADGFLEVHHKSFREFLDKRFPNARTHFEEMMFECALSILKEVPEGGQPSDDDLWDNITLHWSWDSGNHSPKSRKGMLYHKASSTLRHSKVIHGRIIAGDPALFHALRVMTHDVELSDSLTAKESLHVPPSNPTLPPRLDDEGQKDGTTDTFHCDSDEHIWTYKRQEGGYHVTSRSIYVSEFCKCVDRLQDDLRTAMTESPKDTVTVFDGIDRLGVVIYEYFDPKDPAIQRKYIVPYQFSSSRELQ
ncbi:hypothetical protein AN958_07379 [Leucoagaricus sp. SymC.cos]|nr:hypothetical protein AN958_07379 [Leucoagaricus sp. SymC.cos]